MNYGYIAYIKEVVIPTKECLIRELLPHHQRPWWEYLKLSKGNCPKNVFLWMLILWNKAISNISSLATMFCKRKSIRQEVGLVVARKNTCRDRRTSGSTPCNGVWEKSWLVEASPSHFANIFALAVVLLPLLWSQLYNFTLCCGGSMHLSKLFPSLKTPLC